MNRPCIDLISWYESCVNYIEGEHLRAHLPKVLGHALRINDYQQDHPSQSTADYSRSLGLWASISVW